MRSRALNYKINQLHTVNGIFHLENMLVRHRMTGPPGRLIGLAHSTQRSDDTVKIMLHSNFTQQRIFIVGDGSLFESCVTSLLTDENDFVVTRQTYSDDRVFLNTIKLNKPDVILVCESGSFDPSRIVDLVSSHSMEVELPVFIVRLHKNMIDVYENRTPAANKKSPRRKRIMTSTGEDLRNAIRREYNHQ